MNPSFAHEGFKVSLSRLVSRFLRTLGHDEHMFDFIIATNMGLHFGRMAKPDFQVLIKNNHYLSEHQALAQETCRPVGPGDPLKAHFPTGTRLQEHSDSVEVHEPGRDARCLDVGDVGARWLYRGYLVGNVNGHISGRWRDTLSPSDLPGYEGCFVMSRRR
ncbi:hypothetical protein L210DRAFT_3541394 [Boletus edulis BED1]|uniref:Uncharacterized protein n=1 Tax=Boletus edulis BED1 TaxID=1328754 RepID=A0AAD4BTV7_BOLED|nr:hypothetical protein L210DRAFT_3541394 [Boletus edulis BED1]